MNNSMTPDTLQEAIWLLFCGAPGREKMVASRLGVARSTVSAWAHGDNPVRLETVYEVERMIKQFPVTDFMSRTKQEER